MTGNFSNLGQEMDRHPNSVSPMNSKEDESKVTPRFIMIKVKETEKASREKLQEKSDLSHTKYSHKTLSGFHSRNNTGPGGTVMIHF